MANGHRAISGGAPRHLVRGFAFGLLLANSPLTAHAELTPGLEIAGTKGWVKYENGAYGRLISGSGDELLDVEYWNPRQGAYRRQPITIGGNSRNVPALIPQAAKMNKFLAAAGAAGRVLSNPFVAVISALVTPSGDAGNGELCANIPNPRIKEVCNATQGKVADCQTIQEGNDGWGKKGFTCLASSAYYVPSSAGATFVTVWDNNVKYGDGLGFGGFQYTAPPWNIDRYPDKLDEHRVYGWPIQVSRSAGFQKVADDDNKVPCLDNPTTCIVPDPIPPEVQDKVVPQLVQLHGENRFLADTWEPLTMPPGMEGVTQREMNPGGSFVTDPSEQFEFSQETTPWPDGGTVTQIGTGTITVGENGNSEVKIELPDACGAPGQPICDVRVTNVPEYVAPDLDDEEIEVREYRLPAPSPGSSWLPRSCPEPLQLSYLGQSITVSVAPFCLLLSWLGIGINIAGGLLCAAIVVRT